MPATNPLYAAFIGAHAENDSTFMRLTGGDVIRYQEAVARVHQIANALTAAGVNPGDRVAAQIEKSPEAIFLYLGCVAAGAVFLPLNTAYTITELAYFFGDAEPAAIVCDPAKAAQLAPLAARLSAQLLTLGTDGTGSLTDASESQSATYAPVARSADDLAAILYTSGTTGRSKGAMLTHNNLLSNVQTLKDYWYFTKDDVLLHALPIFHTHGLFVACNVVLASGASMIFQPRFSVDAAIDALPRATTMMGVPTFYTRLLDDSRLDKQLVANMRLFVSGSAPLLAQTHIDFEARTSHRILERYGMSETCMNTSNPYHGQRRAGTVGFALPGVAIRVVDAQSGAALPNGEIGMIEVKGPNVFKGYWRMPQRTTAEFRKDGFFITGDLGRFDDEGYLVIVGRDKDLIISGGLNIYPKEVETAIDALAGVEESAVIGAPHPDFGEGAIAVVVAEPGAALDQDTVIAGVSEKLAKFKQPKRVYFVDALPRNAMGKVQKKALRDRYADTF
jgi:malonyl-CoA/methylmalonyl-CoA synthetase